MRFVRDVTVLLAALAAISGISACGAAAGPQRASLSSAEAPSSAHAPSSARAPSSAHAPSLHNNPSAGFHTAGYPGIFFLGAGHPIIIDSRLS